MGRGRTRRRLQAERLRRLQRLAGTALLIPATTLCALLVLFPSGHAIGRANHRVWEIFQAMFGWLPYAEAFTPVRLEMVWNIVMFVPLGLGLALLLPRWWWVPVLHMLSLGIETTQLVLYSSRSATAMDVVMNTTGGIIGVGLGIALDRLRRHRIHGPTPAARSTTLEP